MTNPAQSQGSLYVVPDEITEQDKIDFFYNLTLIMLNDELSEQEEDILYKSAA